MYKKIKFTTACILSMSIIGLIGPNNMSKKAYAEVSTYSLADRGELKSLDIKTTDGQSVDICDDYNGHKKDLTDEKIYYATIDEKSDGVKIYAEAAGDDYVVKVFESDRGNATPHDMGENITVSKGQSTLYIRTFTSQDALKRAVDDEEVTNCDKTYKINISKTPTDGADDIYLRRLTLDGGNTPINFNQDTLSYDVSVNENADEVMIKAEPENDDSTVKIDGFKVDEDDKYKKDVHLQTGKNQIKVNVTDDDAKIRTYILNITRGKVAAADTNTSTTGKAIVKANQWVQVNGQWQYNDSFGNPIKNAWCGSYYLKSDGNMATGWLLDNTNWYYLGTSGKINIGWQDINSKWYYFDINGIMLKDTTINGYKLGTDGAWIE